jgi:hypothetical protein
MILPLPSSKIPLPGCAHAASMPAVSSRREVRPLSSANFRVPIRYLLNIPGCPFYRAMVFNRLRNPRKNPRANPRVNMFTVCIMLPAPALHLAPLTSWQFFIIFILRLPPPTKASPLLRMQSCRPGASMMNTAAGARIVPGFGVTENDKSVGRSPLHSGVERLHLGPRMKPVT